LNLPSGKPTSETNPKPKINTVIITEQGSIQLNDREMTGAVQDRAGRDKDNRHRSRRGRARRGRSGLPESH
jgi:hypothetical protein